MKNVAIVSGSVVLLVGMVAVASATEPAGSISKASLSSMGLGGMQSISRAEGLGVRGRGVFFGGLDKQAKPKLHAFLPKKKVDMGKKGFDPKFGKKSFDSKFGKKGFDPKFKGKGFDFKFKGIGFDFGKKNLGGKGFGGGAFLPKKTFGNFGGGFKFH